MDSTSRRTSRLFVLPAIGVVAVSFMITDLVFMIKDSHYTDIKLPAFRTTTKTAAILNGLAVVPVVLVSISHPFNLKPRWIFRAVLGWLGALVALGSAILTLNVLILKKINPTMVQSSDSKNDLSTVIELIVWAFTTSAALTFYVVFAFMSYPKQLVSEYDEPNSAPLTPLGEKKRRSPPNRPPTPPSPLRLVAPPFALPEASVQLLSPPPSAKRASWRDSLASLHQVVRPQNSRQRLLHGQTSTARSSMSKETQSIVSTDTKSGANSVRSRSDTVDSFTWDFWTPETQTRDTLAAPITTRKGPPMPIGTALETIPGSRPVSPAKTLEAFSEPEAHPPTTAYYDDASTPPEASQSYSRASEHTSSRYTVLSNPSTSTITLPELPERPASSLSRFDLPRPGTSISTHSASRLPTLPSSRPATPSAGEAHIHPLFRTDSPGPAPAVSTNTVIIASPFSGQLIGQLPGLPPQTRSRAASRTGSREGAATFSFVAPGSGRSTPVGRATPVARPLAIPDFVLGASKERLI